MKKLVLLVAMLLLGSVAFLAWGRLASAQSFHTGSNVMVNEATPINKTVFAAGQTVDIDATVYGDVFCAGQTVTVSGTIHGDVICAGQTVTVSGHVYGDVRLAGQSVSLSAVVDGNATIGAQTFKLSSGGSVAGDVTTGSTDTVFDGAVGRNVIAGGETLTFAGKVGGDVTAMATHVQLLSSAKLQGNIEYTSDNKLSQASGATVAGTITQKTPSHHDGRSKHGAIFGFGFGWFVYVLLAFAFTATMLSLLFPQLLRSVSEQAITRPWRVLLAGFLSMFVVPVVLFVCAMTVVGIPLAVLGGIAWLLILSLSGLFFAYYIGRLVLRSARHTVLTMLAGVAVVTVAYFIPVLGFLVWLASLWFGTGMLLLELFRRTPRPAYEGATPTSAKKARK